MDVATVDPLDKLFIQPEATIQEIAAFLVDYCRIDLENNRIKFFEDQWILVESRVLLCLLCLRVMVYKKQRKTNKLRPREIVELTQVLGGSIRPKLQLLLDERLIQRDKGKDDGRAAQYFIPAGGVYRAMKHIRKTTRTKD